MDTKYEAGVERAIDSLAEESQVPIHIVTQLYNAERIKLEAGARITSFISILAIRNVRSRLRRSGNTPVALTAAVHPHRMPA